ncbi:hypothetical protein [Actinobaculum sp. 313]|uniref:hypothetical protein n=1 Tax=Actinobaculum sp. 313 TaxID=2495645 RepID=UPI0032048743
MTETHTDSLGPVLEGADSAVRIQDDLFHAINGTWLATQEIPSDLSSYGSFMKLHVEAEQQVHEIIEELVALAPLKVRHSRSPASSVRGWIPKQPMRAEHHHWIVI